MAVRFVVNGVSRSYADDPSLPLLWYLRDHLDLPGTRYGCGMSLCGCCTVHVDGQAVRSCSVAVGDLEGKAVVTIEGLSAPLLHPLQVAWIKHAVSQCGYCQSGQIMQAAAFLAQQPEPSDAGIDAAMAGNLCRCGTYPRIRRAIRDAAATLRGASK